MALQIGHRISLDFDLFSRDEIPKILLPNVKQVFLEQLIYLEDIGREKIEFLKKPVTKEEMVDFFEKEIKKLKL